MEPQGMPAVTVGGVPEHFNLPWYTAVERKEFEEEGVKVNFKEVPGGTGAMMGALRDGSIDIVVALTEGIISNIIKDPERKVALVGAYTDSPLTWAISAGGSSAYDSVASLKEQPVGVSRLGSGSHLMSFLLAEREGWDPKKMEFQTLGNIDGLKKGVNEGSAAFFMWETFMTKPYHDAGELKRLGDIKTPWPCFMMAARKEWLQKEENKAAVKKVLKVIQASCAKFKSDKEPAVKSIAERFTTLKPEDAGTWFDTVEYSKDSAIFRNVLEETEAALKRVGIIEETVPISELVDESVATLSDEKWSWNKQT